MKTIILVSTALFLSFASFAQSGSTINRKENKADDCKTVEMSNTDGVMMKNGGMVTVKKGKMAPMANDLICKDGTRVSSSGSISKKDGSQKMLKEGEYMDVCGKVIPITNSEGSSRNNDSKNTKDRNMYLVPDSTLQKNK